MSNAMAENKVISFDVGSRHLAFCQCVVHGDNHINITRWEVHNISENSIEKSVEKCMLFLKTTFYNVSGTTILIERQYHKNIKSYVLSYIIYTYFTTKRMNVKFVNASIKPIKNKNVGRKVESIRVALNLLQESWKEFLENAAKKDDLADCYLQIVGYLQSLSS
jgi:hypothetical protein